MNKKNKRKFYQAFAVTYLCIMYAVGTHQDELSEQKIFSDRVDFLAAETELIGTTYNGQTADVGYEYYQVTSTLKNNGGIKKTADGVWLEYSAEIEYNGEMIEESCREARLNITTEGIDLYNELIIPPKRTGKKVDVIQVPIGTDSLVITYHEPIEENSIKTRTKEITIRF